jgi:Mrp family chromosome partitioning ATPase
VLWGKLDYLIVDLPPGTSDASLTVMQSIPAEWHRHGHDATERWPAMVVRKASSMASQLEIPILGVIENMSYVRLPRIVAEPIEVFGPSNGGRSWPPSLGVPLPGAAADRALS